MLESSHGEKAHTQLAYFSSPGEKCIRGDAKYWIIGFGIDGFLDCSKDFFQPKDNLSMLKKLHLTDIYFKNEISIGFFK